MISLEDRGKEARVYYEALCQHGGRCLDCLEKAVRGACNGAIHEMEKELKAANLKNQELQHEIARLIRNEKCYGCGHSRENHDPGGCLVWIEADAHRKCLCRVWTAGKSELATNTNLEKYLALTVQMLIARDDGRDEDPYTDKLDVFHELLSQNDKEFLNVMGSEWSKYHQPGQPPPKKCSACTCPHDWKTEKSHTAHPDGPTACGRCGVEA